ncbi:MAG: HAD family hydrolase [Candidatus Fermentibacteraceae bacterium]|nr:HAD family hydrolase [Candidatus Fermentibacteraceae bacterium]MBN2608838.1 HAD family hydrolase [Candidatus Fermentibacteraceae bacterium]
MRTTGTVIFDLDGTLHCTEKALVPAIRMAMADLGFPPASAEVINALYGEPLEVFSRVLLSDEGKYHADFQRSIRKHQRTTLPRSGALYPGTLDMLEELRIMGMILAVCSNAGLDYIGLVTRSLGIIDLFRFLVGRDGQASKADRVAGIIEDSGTPFNVMVGDRYHDIQAAAENGIPSIGCLYGYGGEGEMADSDRQVASPPEIPKVVRELLMGTARSAGATPAP